MKDVLTILLLLCTFAVCMFPWPESFASEYKSNFTHIPAVEKYPIRAGTWQRTPTVIICEYAPVKRNQINKAVQFWSDLGHSFFRTQYKHDPLNKCRSTQPVGYITVHLVHQDLKLDPDSLAETHFFVNNETNEIEWATIYMRSTIPETVLEHELGHALGYLHYNKINHLMNSKWTQGGWDTEGLQETRR